MSKQRYRWPSGIGVKNHFAMALASWFGIGFLPGMPGTWGSLAAAILAPFVFMPFSILVRLILCALIFWVGALAASCAEQVQKEKDPGYVVVDEVAGQWLTYALFLNLGFWGFALGFILFRIFDIFKPWPVNASEKWLPRGWGIMIDDILAGGYAGCVLGVFRFMDLV